MTTETAGRLSEKNGRLVDLNKNTLSGAFYKKGVQTFALCRMPVFVICGAVFFTI